MKIGFFIMKPVHVHVECIIIILKQTSCMYIVSCNTYFREDHPFIKADNLP